MPQAAPGAKPRKTSFDQPIEALSACHRRLQDRCHSLSQLPGHIAQHGLNDEARETAQAIMRYFDGPALYHHADEEQDLFPALLLSMAGSDAVCLRELFARLTHEHRQLEKQWQTLRPLLEQLSLGHSAQLPEPQIKLFIGANIEHMQCEEGELLPLARRLLDTAALQDLSHAMYARRN